jgi:hypothetical protein
MNITAYTDSLRLTGTIVTHHRRLTDLLVQEGIELITLEDCLVISLQSEAQERTRQSGRGSMVTRINDFGAEELIEPLEDKLVGRVHIRRQQLLFAIQNREVESAEPVAPGSTSGELRLRVAKEQHAMRAILGNWDLRGYLHFSPEVNLAEAIKSMRSGFLPMTDAYAVNLVSDRLTLGPDTIIVQREKIEALWSVEDET